MSTSSKHLPLIGIAGTFASGKDTYATHLASTYGYKVVSTSDIVRRLSMERHGSVERPHLFETAEHFRKTYGPRFSEIIIQEYDNHDENNEYTGLAITGLRVTGEIKTIRAHGGIIVFIDAPVQIRYQRMKARNRDQEVELTLEQFQANEQKEWYGGPTEADFNLRDIKASADIVMEEVLPVDQFNNRLDQLLHLVN